MTCAMFRLNEAAEALARQAVAFGMPEWEVSEMTIWESLRRAAEDGQLRMRHPGTGLPEKFSEWPDPSRYELVALVEDLNAWLESSGVPYRLPHEQQHEAPRLAPTLDRATAACGNAPALGPHHLVRKEGGTRRDELTPLIDDAVHACGGTEDPSRVWAHLCKIAEGKSPPPPLICRDDTGALKYRQANSDVPGFFDIKALRKRLRRRADKARLDPQRSA